MKRSAPEKEKRRPSPRPDPASLASGLRSSEGELSLHDFIHIIRKRYLVFLLTVSLVTLGGVAITLNLQPIYQSRATILIERPPVTSEWQLFTEEKDFKMVMQLLNSQSLLFDALGAAGIASNSTHDIRLSAKMQSDSTMVDITVEDTNPRRLITVFRHFLPMVATRVTTLEGQNLIRKVDFIKSQLKVVEDRLAGMDKVLQKHAETEMDVSMSDKLAKINAEITRIQDERRMAEIDLSVVGDLLKDLQKKTVSAGRTTKTWDTTLQELVELKTTLLQLERERIKLTSLYQPLHPDVKSVDDQIVFVKQQIEEKSAAVATSSLVIDSSGQVGAYVFQKLLELEAQQKTMVLKIAQLDTLLGEKTAKFKSLLSRMEEFNMLMRRQKVDEAIHLSLIEKLNQAEVDKGTMSVTVRVISEPIEPTNPNRPNYSRYMVFSLLIGLLAGGLLAYLQENFDNSIKSTDDAQQCFGLQNLGSIPDLIHLLETPTDPKVEIAPALVTFHHRSSPEAEAFRTLRTTLLYKAQQNPFKTLIVTSWGRNLGKSTVTANLAMAYAQSGMKVILVDCDLHKPTLHHLFFLQNHRGFTDLIMGDHLEKVLRPTAQPNLFVIPTGPLPPNPSELLGSQSMDIAIRLLTASADLVIFDMPPLMAVADSAVLAGKVDAVLFLVPIGKESRRYALKGLDLLRLVKAPLIGMVCNFLKRHEFEGYRYHYHV